MRSFFKRFLMHYGIYRRYPLARLPALRNAWRTAQPLSGSGADVGRLMTSERPEAA